MNVQIDRQYYSTHSISSDGFFTDVFTSASRVQIYLYKYHVFHFIKLNLENTF